MIETARRQDGEGSRQVEDRLHRVRDRFQTGLDRMFGDMMEAEG
jgi:hypothetical protein